MYALGIKDRDALKNIFESFVNDETIVPDDKKDDFFHNRNKIIGWLNIGISKVKEVLNP